MSITPEQKSEIFLTNANSTDCAVVMIQALTGVSRHWAEKVARTLGYIPDERGMSRPFQRLAIEKITNLNVCDLPISRMVQVVGVEGETGPTFAGNHSQGRYAIYIKNHVAALVDGDLTNLAKRDWRAPLEEVWKLVPLSELEEASKSARYLTDSEEES
jgi:hypothetical protein